MIFCKGHAQFASNLLNHYTQGDLTQILPTFLNPILNLNFSMHVKYSVKLCRIVYQFQILFTKLPSYNYANLYGQF